MNSETENKKVVRSKKLLTDAFWELLHERAGEKFTIKDICERANYTRATFYAHFNQLEDVPYFYYKKNWWYENVESYLEYISESKEQKLPARKILHYLIKSSFTYWETQVEAYKLLKSIEMDRLLPRLFEEGLRLLYGSMYPDHNTSNNSITEKCIIKGHAQLLYITYDIWAYSGREIDIDEMASAVMRIIDGASGLGEK